MNKTKILKKSITLIAATLLTVAAMLFLVRSSSENKQPAENKEVLGVNEDNSEYTFNDKELNGALTEVSGSTNPQIKEFGGEVQSTYRDQLESIDYITVRRSDLIEALIVNVDFSVRRDKNIDISKRLGNSLSLLIEPGVLIQSGSVDEFSEFMKEVSEIISSEEPATLYTIINDNKRNIFFSAVYENKNVFKKGACQLTMSILQSNSTLIR